MSAVDDAARMLTLVPWLLERPGASLAEVARAFDVDEETIRTDLARLDVASLPGLAGGEVFWVTVVGDRVVVRMAEELRRPLRLTPREALQLVLALSAVSAALGEEVPALRSGLGKLREALGIPADVATQVDELRDAAVADARRALAEGRSVRVSYRGRKDAAPQERRVDPWALQIVDGAWYLQGHDDDAGGLRTFRLDRVAALEVLEEARTREPPDGELPTPAYVPGPDDLEVELRLETDARWVLDALGPEHVVEEPGGEVLVRLRTDAPRYLARLLVVAGPTATVESPDHLGAMVQDLARAALRRHRGDPGSDLE